MSTTPTTTLPPPPSAAAGPGPLPASPPPGWRIAWLVVGSVLAIGLLVFGTFSVIDVLAHERTTEVTTFDGVGTLVIGNEEGTVRVTAADVDEVTVRASISEGLRSTSVGRRIDGDRLILQSSCPNFGGTWCSVDWEVEVPRGTDLVIRSGGERARATGEFGAVDMRSEYDGVTFDGVARSVVAVSEHGSIAVRLGAPPESVSASTDDGDVEIIVPDVEEAYRVDVRSDHGDIDVGVRTDPASSRTIDARSDHGDVTVRMAP